MRRRRNLRWLQIIGDTVFLDDYLTRYQTWTDVSPPFTSPATLRRDAGPAIQ